MLTHATGKAQFVDPGASQRVWDLPTSPTTARDLRGSVCFLGAHDFGALKKCENMGRENEIAEHGKRDSSKLNILHIINIYIYKIA